MGARERCAIHLAEHHAGEAARLLERFPSSEAGRFLERLLPPVGAQVLKHVSVGRAAAHLGAMGPSVARAVLAALPGDLGASMLRRQGAAVRDSLLEGLAPAARRSLERRLEYPAGAAGALADSDVPALVEQLTVTEARRQLRQTWPAAHRYVYVTDDAHRLVGVVRAAELASARARASLASIMTTDVISLAANADLPALLAHPAWRQFDPLPVVDRAGVFIGAIRHQKLRELGTSTEGSSLTDTLLHLGELYWVGLSTVFPAASGAEGRSTGPSNEDADHGT